MLLRLPAVSLLLVCAGWLLAPSTARAQTKYEAEAGSPQVQLNKANIGSNNGVTYAENLTQVGSAVTFTVSVPTAGRYTVAARYAAARDYNWTMSVYVNGADAAQAQFATTASWSSWSTQAVTVALQAGSNTIKYQYDADDSGWINLDYILISSATTPGYTGGSAAASALPAELSVNKFTGTASFDAPLHTLTIPGFSLPIALHYAATGVQAGDTGGEVGLNWSLQAGLSISRQVRDLPDDIRYEDSSTPEHRYGWLRYPASGSPSVAGVASASAAISSPGCTAAEQNAFNQLTAFGSLARGPGNAAMYDTEPDVFSYAVPGYSGKFVFDQGGSIRLLPYAPVQITPLFAAQPEGCTTNVPPGELTGFLLVTAEGVTYRFVIPTRITQRTQTTAPYGGTKYQLRRYWSYLLPTAYTTGWLVSRITTPAGKSAAGQPENSITFGYDCASFIPRPEAVSSMFTLGSSGGYPTADQSLTTIVLTNPKLASITTASAVVTLARQLDELDDFHVTALTVTSPLENNALVKAYAFQYSNSGRFITQVTLNRATSTLPLYSFTYAPDADAGTSQPAADRSKTNLGQDYWGFVNNSGSPTSIPRLYLYPQLLGTATPVPAAPYRLYPMPVNQGEVVLPGADRRPANRLSVALAGTLTSVQFATGGQVTLEYEQNQFYDPVAQQSLPAGGLRLRTLKVQDPITLVETRRDYGYQQPGSNGSGVASGVLLHEPRFAFAMPLTSSTQWADATVRSAVDLATDPFESRAVGYRQVTESTPGRGQVVTTYAAPAGADDNASPADATANLPGWQRPVFGVARQPVNGNCPGSAPLQAVADLYPFAPAPNYDFARGLVQRVQYLAEPTGAGAAGSLVRQEDYAYQYTNARPDRSVPVTGLCYEQLGDPSIPQYAYAQYTLLTDYLYLPRQQTVTQYAAGGATTQTTGYRYNAQGWLAARITLGSDQVLTRTRYKYLSDYPLPGSGASGALLAMQTRLGEGVSSDPVEVISEIRPLGSTGHVAYAGATLQTFTTATLPDPVNTGSTLTTPTYPYQRWRWQPAQPVASYDSVRVAGNALYVPAALRLAATVQAVDLNLTPLTLRTEAGRQVLSKQVGYDGTVPLLQVANATATEVVFADFEATRTPAARLPAAYSYLPNSANNQPQVATGAARTGKAGLVLFGGSGLTTNLPPSTAPQYRLVYWARSAAATSSTVTVGNGQSTAISQTFQHNGFGQWQRCELLLPLASLSNRTSYSLTITAASGPALQVDDVLLLPAEATAASTTYTLATGKTTETDGRGRTSYYEYGPTGDLTLVRDANQAIVHQYRKVLPGQALVSGILFAATGTLMEQDPVTFTANVTLTGDLTYKWDFGDGVIKDYPAGISEKHNYPITNKSQGYQARLYVKSQGIEYQSAARFIAITPQPIVLTTCTAGVVSIDDCHHATGNTVDTSCNPNAPDSNNQTTFQVKSNLAGCSYRWECINHNDPASNWQDAANTTNTLTTPRTDVRSYRCHVTLNQQEVVSEELAINHYQSDMSCPR